MDPVWDFRRLLSHGSRVFAAVVVVCGAAQHPGRAQAQPPPDSGLSRAKKVFVAHFQADQEFAAAEALLARARTAHDQAIANDDSSGIDVTSEAISNAQQAMDHDRQNLADDRLRLNVIDHVLAKLGLPDSDSADRSERLPPSTPKKQSDSEEELLVDTLLSSGMASSWPGPANPEKPVVNPLTAPHEATLDADSRLLLVMADQDITDSRFAGLREATLRECSNALGARYHADPEFRRRMDEQPDVAITAVSAEREREVDSADERRFARLRNVVDELEKHGLVQKGKPLADQENADPALHGALEDARTQTRADEATELKAIADGTAADLKARIQKLAADNRLSEEVWEKQARSQ